MITTLGSCNLIKPFFIKNSKKEERKDKRVERKIERKENKIENDICIICLEEVEFINKKQNFHCDCIDLMVLRCRRNLHHKY